MRLEIGESAEISRTITDDDVRRFAELSLDSNPLHLDDDFAATTPFGRRIAHGMLPASLISAVLGTRLPGPGCIYLKQDLRFLAPVFIGETVTARVSVSELGERNRCVLDTEVTKDDGTVVVTGTATLLLPAEAR
jgi:3-hydroxybutyryl-CoA dehydratase